MHGRFKSLERVRFELWWAGDYSGDLEPIRRYMVERLDRLLSPIRKLRDRYDDPLDAAEAAVDGDELLSRHPVLRVMRRFAKTDENLRSAVFSIFHDLFGGDVAWESPDTGLDDPEPSLRDLVEQTMGVGRPSTARISSGEPVLDRGADIVRTIQGVHRLGVIDLDHPGSAIANSTDGIFEIAAARARLISEGLTLAARVSALRHGRAYAGLGILARINASDPTLVAFAMQLSLRLPLLLQTDQDRENAGNTFTALQEHLGSMRCTDLFCKEYPGYAFIFKVDQSARVQALIDEERELLRQTVAKFTQKHPECARLLASDR